MDTKRDLPHILFFDLDGTLCEKGLMPNEETISSLKRAKERGHLVFLNTGRAPCLVYEEFRSLPWSGLITGMGACVEYEGKILRDLPFTTDELDTLERYFVQHNLVYLLQGETKMFMDLQKFSDLRLEQRHGINFDMVNVLRHYHNNEILDLSSRSDEEIYGVLLFGTVGSDLANFQEHFEGLYRASAHPTTDSSQITDFDISRVNVHKGEAVQFVCDAFNIPLSRSIAFGDSMNDYEMIKTVGLGVVMENGDDEIKSHADAICPSVRENGVSQMLQRLGLL